MASPLITGTTAAAAAASSSSSGSSYNSNCCCYDNDGDDDDDDNGGGGLTAVEGGVRDEPRSESAVNNCQRFVEIKKSFSLRTITHTQNK